MKKLLSKTSKSFSTYHASQSGMTLIEAMISLIIGSLAVAASISLISVITTNQKKHALSTDRQISLNSAESIIKDVFDKKGFQNLIMNPPSSNFRCVGSGFCLSPNKNINNISNTNSDLIYVAGKQGVTSFYELANSYDKNNSEIILVPNTKLGNVKKGSWLVVTNQRQSELVRVYDVATNSGKIKVVFQIAQLIGNDNRLQGLYKQGDQVYPANIYSFGLNAQGNKLIQKNHSTGVSKAIFDTRKFDVGYKTKNTLINLPQCNPFNSINNFSYSNWTKLNGKPVCYAKIDLLNIKISDFPKEDIMIRVNNSY